MSRRSRRGKPLHLMGAVLIEVGTMIAIVAVAQPTWTSGWIEQVMEHGVKLTAPEGDLASSPADTPQRIGNNSLVSKWGSEWNDVERVASLASPPMRYSVASNGAVARHETNPWPAIYPPMQDSFKQRVLLAP